MTIIIAYDQKGSPVYRSAKGAGSLETEREKARQLDALLKKEFSALGKKLNLKENFQADVGGYWELGLVLRNIFYKSKLVDSKEKYLYWVNAAMHAPKVLMAKDRGPNRLHLDYCFRLANFKKEKAKQLNWGEWVYLFDSSGINREARFDVWLEKKMQQKHDFTREDIRLLSQCINKLLGKIETSDLDDEQLFRCYEAAFSLKERLKEIDKGNRDMIKTGIDIHFGRFGDVIKGKLQPEAFAKIVFGSGLTKVRRTTSPSTSR